MEQDNSIHLEHAPLTTDQLLSLPPVKICSRPSFTYLPRRTRFLKLDFFKVGDSLQFMDEHFTKEDEVETCLYNETVNSTAFHGTVWMVEKVKIWIVSKNILEPKEVQKVGGIFWFRCLKKENQLYAPVRCDGIPIRFGRLIPSRNDTESVYIVRLCYREKGSNPLIEPTQQLEFEFSKLTNVKEAQKRKKLREVKKLQKTIVRSASFELREAEKEVGIDPTSLPSPPLPPNYERLERDKENTSKKKQQTLEERQQQPPPLPPPQPQPPNPLDTFSSGMYCRSPVISKYLELHPSPHEHLPPFYNGQFCSLPPPSSFLGRAPVPLLFPTPTKAIIPVGLAQIPTIPPHNNTLPMPITITIDPIYLSGIPGSGSLLYQ